VEMHQGIKDAFLRSDISGVLRLVEQYFDTGDCSLWHLFKDEQRKVLNQILDETLKEVEGSLRQINEHHYSIIQVMRQLHVPLPRTLSLIEELMLNTGLFDLLEGKKIDIPGLQKLIEKIREGAFNVDRTTLNFLVSNKVNAMMGKFARYPQDSSLLEAAESLLWSLQPLSLKLDLWEAQNIYFSTGKQLFSEMKERADAGDEKAVKWMARFKDFGDHLKVRII
jgi:hypothetical protein